MEKCFTVIVFYFRYFITAFEMKLRAWITQLIHFPRLAACAFYDVDLDSCIQCWLWISTCWHSSFWLNRWQGPCTLSLVEDQRHPSILLSHIWSNTFLLSFRIGSCHTMSASHNAYYSQSQTFAEKDYLNWDSKITDYFSLA